jgi:hypothetical protein
MSLTGKKMRKYGGVAREKNGYSVVEVYEEDSSGNQTLIGYAVLDPDGGEVGFFGNLDDAMDELDRVANGPAPKPSTPSFGM